jgi:hypothetical protein
MNTSYMTLIISSSQHGAGKAISILQTPTHIYATQHNIIIANQPTMQMGVIISSPVIPAICSYGNAYIWLPLS